MKYTHPRPTLTGHAIGKYELFLSFMLISIEILAASCGPGEGAPPPGHDQKAKESFVFCVGTPQGAMELLDEPANSPLVVGKNNVSGGNKSKTQPKGHNYSDHGLYAHTFQIGDKAYKIAVHNMTNRWELKQYGNETALNVKYPELHDDDDKPLKGSRLKNLGGAAQSTGGTAQEKYEESKKNYKARIEATTKKLIERAQGKSSELLFLQETPPSKEEAYKAMKGLLEEGGYTELVVGEKKKGDQKKETETAIWVRKGSSNRFGPGEYSEDLLKCNDKTKLAIGIEYEDDSKGTPVAMHCAMHCKFHAKETKQADDSSVVEKDKNGVPLFKFGEWGEKMGTALVAAMAANGVLQKADNLYISVVGDGNTDLERPTVWEHTARLISEKTDFGVCCVNYFWEPSVKNTQQWRNKNSKNYYTYAGKSHNKYANDGGAVLWLKKKPC